MKQELFSLEGRTALVTGLGRAMALGLRHAGARVAVTGRQPEKNEAIARELGDPTAVFALDVRDEAAVERSVAQVTERFGSLDILVNNAGLLRGGPLMSLSREDWSAVLETHVTGMFLCCKYAAQRMIAHRWGGKILSIGSMYSLFGAPDLADYGTAKTAILGLTRALAVELAPHHIQVNALLPGWYETDPWDARHLTGRTDSAQDAGGAVGKPRGPGRRGHLFRLGSLGLCHGSAVAGRWGYAVAEHLLYE